MRSSMLRRVGPALVAFVLVALGVLVLAGGSKSSSASSEELRSTVVAITSIPAGTTIDQLPSMVEVRMLSANARAQGAIESVELLGDGVLGSDHVAGQQILLSSVVDDERQDLGKGTVAVSAKLDPAQWAGPVAATGTRVNVFAIGGTAAELIATNVVIIDAPDPSSLTPQQEAIITLGVATTDVARVIGAVSSAGIWLVTA